MYVGIYVCNVFVYVRTYVMYVMQCNVVEWNEMEL